MARKVGFMFILILIVIVVTIASFMIRNKVVIHIRTFFRKGFHKHTDDYGLYTFVAEQGGGKTYSCVDYLSSLTKKKTVITNVKSYYEHYKSTTIYENDFNRIIDLMNEKEDCSEYIIFYDEIFSLLSNTKLSLKIRNFLTQLRKKNLYLLTTCQIWSDLPLTFRRLSRYVVICRMINIPIFDFAICINEINDGYQTKWDSDAQDFVSPRIRTTVKKCSKKIAESYDTFEAIIGRV